MDETDHKELIEALSRVTRSLDNFGRPTESGRNTGQQGGMSSVRISQDAGKAPAWIAASCCAFMLGTLIPGAFWISGEFGETDQQLIELREENKTMQSFLSAIYQIAPHLKPEEKSK